MTSVSTAQSVKRTVIEECDIENPGTRKFLEEVDYAADTAYTLSHALEYMQEYGANRTGSMAFLIEAQLGVSGL